MSFKWIEEELKKTGKQKKDLAKALNLTSVKISNLLSDSRLLKMEEAPMLASFFDMSLDEVYQRSGMGVPGEVTIKLSGMQSPQAEKFSSAPDAIDNSDDLLLDTFERALQIGLEMDCSSEQSKRAAKAAVNSARKNNTEITDFLIQHYLHLQLKSG